MLNPTTVHKRGLKGRTGSNKMAVEPFVVVVVIIIITVIVIIIRFNSYKANYKENTVLGFGNWAERWIYTY
jgi:hypothetical protein